MSILDEKTDFNVSELFRDAFSNVGREFEFKLEKQIDWLSFLEAPKQSEFGDVAFNGAMRLFGVLEAEIKQKIGSPLNLAEIIKKSVFEKKQQQLLIKKLEVIKPGYINIYFDEKCFLKKTDEFLLDKSIKFLDLGEQKSVIVEYSSPNIAKPFTIGHLRSTVIGTALANLLETVNYRVYRDNHMGDWGTQFGKQIVAVEKWGSWDKIYQAENPIKELVALYVEFHEQALLHPELEDEARAAFKKLEEGDEKMHQMWEKCIELSLKEFNKIYKRMDVEFTENEGRGYGEGAMVKYIPEVIEELKAKNLLKESEGAQVVFFEGMKLPPLIIVKNDDSSIYASRDLATDYFRKQNYPQPLQIINEVGMEQNLYFKQLYKTEEMLGWFKPGERVHIGHGLYRFKDRKMSTRKGDVIWLEDVLDEAFNRVKEKSKGDLSDAHIDAIAIGALKWNDLSREAKHNIDFDFEEILSVKGNSGPYMQYTLVRIVAILNKMLANPTQGIANDIQSVTEVLTLARKKLLEEDKFELANASVSEKELALAKRVGQFSNVVAEAAKKYAPHVLCNYLYELASDFNLFYAQEPILGDKKREMLSLATGLVINKGLAILGIKSLVRM